MDIQFSLMRVLEKLAPGGNLEGDNKNCLLGDFMGANLLKHKAEIYVS